MPAPEQSKHLIYSKMILIKIKERQSVSLTTDQRQASQWNRHLSLMMPPLVRARPCLRVCPLVLEEVHKKLTLPLQRGFLDHLLRQVMGLDGLIEAKFSSTVAAPHRVPSSSAHCSIKGSFRGRASSTCTYAEHTLMWDETDIFKLREREGRREKKNKK